MMMMMIVRCARADPLVSGTVSDAATDAAECPSPSLDAADVRHLRRRFVRDPRQSVHVFQRDLTCPSAGHASHLLTSWPCRCGAGASMPRATNNHASTLTTVRWGSSYSLEVWGHEIPKRWTNFTEFTTKNSALVPISVDVLPYLLRL